MKINEKYGKRYYDTKQNSAFIGAKSFKRELQRSKVKFDSKEVDGWLSGQDPYTRHRRIIHKFQRRPTTTSSPGVQFQADLLDAQSHANDNDGFKFILTVIDVFSKRGWAIPIKNKSGEVVARALEKLFMDETPLYLQTDKGKEFYNTHVAKVLQEFKVIHFSSENDNIKASIVERFNQTLRNVLHRAFTKMGRYRFVDILQDVVDGYNDRFHSAIGMSPNQINPSNQEDVWLKLHNNALHFQTNKPKLQIGDSVRITKSRTAFQRGYTPNWSSEVFYVKKVLATSPVTYKIKDFHNEDIAGSFYERELQKIKEPEFYDVEKILERKKIGGKKMALVKWMGYPAEFNQWIPESDIVNK